MIPLWLHWLSILSLLLAAVCAVLIALDLRRHPQKMWIMGLVWPLVALFGSLAALIAYRRVGRAEDSSFAASVGTGAAHCGAGCTLGDIIAEWLVIAVPGVAVWFGYGSLFRHEIFAVWILDYILAFGIGVVFQYFAIAPMRGLGLRAGLVQAVKADALSLTSWQVGMYGFMAVAHFWLFGHVLGVTLEPASVEFWFMMQIAMLCGFTTAYPVNWWLIRRGIKERM
ncbi:DUF4396 domain-containing protein [Pseudoroseicyclus aestuarii]|uniref:Uncharacterized protein DUF4396 n=1 Tax=Pseudoroseicyclus aestuarii TaxID=1795041 RepID=A0A318SPZ0_9RHOB|nr:DUF4396 domain-containing protein [Pseudoroseicyclus aestuarii]PYE82408.1 uncharacterized protein DUF4396 [Pseudoroseicyclus aestuarii]